ncbi:hypothetical protein J1N35_034291, partial [Gossypium stocksii]
MWEETYIDILIHQGSQVNMKQITSLKPFEATNEMKAKRDWDRKKCEREKKVEKESEIEEKNESVKETSVVVKEREFENELEKETDEKGAREQEKVSRNPFGEFQLQYLPNERRFQLIDKGKIEVDVNPQVLK